MDPISELLTDWLDDAEVLERHGHEREANQLRKRADEVDNAQRAWELEPLTIPDAAQKSGYSKDHLRKLIREGVIPNAGKLNSPRIQRQHLPRKPGHNCTSREEFSVHTPPSVDSPVEMARSVVNSTDEGGHDG